MENIILRPTEMKENDYIPDIERQDQIAIDEIKREKEIRKENQEFQAISDIKRGNIYFNDFGRAIFVTWSLPKGIRVKLLAETSNKNVNLCSNEQEAVDWGVKQCL